MNAPATYPFRVPPTEPNDGAFVAVLAVLAILVMISAGLFAAVGLPFWFGGRGGGCPSGPPPLADDRRDVAANGTLDVPFILHATAPVWARLSVTLPNGSASWTGEPENQTLWYVGDGAAPPKRVGGGLLWTKFNFTGLDVSRTGTYRYAVRFPAAAPDETPVGAFSLYIDHQAPGESARHTVEEDRRAVLAGTTYATDFQIPSAGRLTIQGWLAASIPPSWRLANWSAQLLRSPASGNGTPTLIRTVPMPLPDPAPSPGDYATIGGDRLANGSYIFRLHAPAGPRVLPRTVRVGVELVRSEDTGLVCAEAGGGAPVGLLLSTPVALLAFSVLLVIGVARTETAQYAIRARLRRPAAGSGGSADQFTRGRLLGYITANPGAAVIRIRSDLQLANGTTLYHLYLLEKEGLVTSRRDGIRRRFYPRSSGGEAPKLRSLSMTQALILDLIRDHPGIAQREIATRARASQQVVSYHIVELERANLLEATLDRREKRLRLSERSVEPQQDGTYRLRDGTVLTVLRPE